MKQNELKLTAMFLIKNQGSFFCLVKHQLNSKTSTCLSRVTKTIKVSDIYRLVKKSYFNSIQILLEIIFGKFDLFLEFWVLKTLKSTLFVWEKVTTTNLTTSKTKKNIKKFANHHCIKSPFFVDHYYDITTSKMAF